ncbi:MAG: PD-(D/E)XK nuclease family protein, partial [bacterium]|nr:PD-(D/E)XK nuclease family protein [bacterium]
GLVPSRRTRLERAAAWVAAATHGGDQEAAERQVAALAERASTPSEAALVEDARVLIREANARSGPDLVELPQHLSASATLALTRSPGEFALNLRRPIPHRPSPEARVGTEFHGWVEHHFNMPTLMGSPEWDEDEDAAGAPQRFAELRARFLESEWALRAPLSVEENLETMIGGQLIRCRIDAVFRRDGEIWVVDWKTGREPRDRAEIEIRQLQLEIYRLAYARANGIPIAEVKAAFHYVATGVTQASGLWQESEIERRILDALESQGALESLSG